MDDFVGRYNWSVYVRITRYNKTFAKQYQVNFTEEIFKITKVHHGDPNMYNLSDLNSEPIIGKFYEQELSLVNVKGEDESREYKIEKILKRKKGKAVVKWEGYDDEYNSWIPISRIEI